MRLSTKIIGVTSFCFIVAVAISATVVYGSVKASSQTQVSTAQEQTTLQTMDKIDRFLYERSIDIQVIGRNDQFRAVSTRTSGAAANSLKEIQRFNGAWSELSVWDMAGRRLVSTDDAAAEVATTNPLANLYQRALAGEVAYSDLTLSPTTGAPTIFYFAPIFSKDQSLVVSGAISGEIAWPAVLEILKSVKGPTATLINRAGLEIGTSAEDDTAGILTNDLHATEAFKATRNNTAASQVLPEIGGGGRPAVTSFAKESGFLSYTGNGWDLVLSTPTVTAFASAQRAALVLLVVFGGIMLAALGIILWFMRAQVLRPVRSLSEVVRRITAGDLTQRAQSTSSDELGQLATAFNQMTSQLSHASDQLQREKIRLEASIDSLPLGFILTDDNNTILSMNLAIQEVLGIKDDDLEGVSRLVKADSSLLAQVLKHSQECLHKQKLLKVNEIAHNGRIMRALFSPVLHQSSTSVRAIGVAILIEDITEARILARSRDEFFSIASHELRTPLTAIRGNVQLIEQYFPDVVKNPDIKELLGDVHTSSVRLIEIVNDFLDASRLEQGKMTLKLESFPLEEVIEKVIYEMGGLLREKKVYLRLTNNLGTLPHVWADQNRIKQIIYNLVGNALKFVSEGGVTIQIEPHKRFLRVLVIDTGEGISSENQQILFHKFQQANTNILTRDTTRGTGLGLYISRLLIEQMGGRVNLEHSEVGKGSTFSVTVPIATKQQQALPHHPENGRLKLK